jgi:hypothetical protein
VAPGHLVKCSALATGALSRCTLNEAASATTPCHVTPPDPAAAAAKAAGKGKKRRKVKVKKPEPDPKDKKAKRKPKTRMVRRTAP